MVSTVKVVQKSISNQTQGQKTRGPVQAEERRRSGQAWPIPSNQELAKYQEKCGWVSNHLVELPSLNRQFGVTRGNFVCAWAHLSTHFTFESPP